MQVLGCFAMRLVFRCARRSGGMAIGVRQFSASVETMRLAPLASAHPRFIMNTSDARAQILCTKCGVSV
jgi:hypothetical protein